MIVQPIILIIFTNCIFEYQNQHLMKATIDGTGVAIVTPFHNYGTVDFTSLGNIIEHIIDGGIDFIVALGTTSEAATLTLDEKYAVVNYIKDADIGSIVISIETLSYRLAMPNKLQEMTFADIP